MLGYASMGGVIMHAVPFEVVSIRGSRRSARGGVRLPEILRVDSFRYAMKVRKQ